MAVEAPISSTVAMSGSETSVLGENGGYPFTNLTSLEISPYMTENLVGGRQIPAVSLSSFEIFNPRLIDTGDRFVPLSSFQNVVHNPEVNPFESEQQIQGDTPLQTDLLGLHIPKTPKSKALSQMIGSYMYLHSKSVDMQRKPFQTERHSDRRAEQERLPTPLLSQELMYHTAISDMEIAVRIRDLSVGLGVDEETATQNTLSIVDTVFHEKHIDPYILQEETIMKPGTFIENPKEHGNISTSEIAETIVFDAIECILFGEKDDAELEEGEELYFVEDAGVNEIRSSLAMSIADDLITEEETISGLQIAKRLPDDPQPNKVKSSILKETLSEDGSYTSFVQSLAKFDKLQTLAEANEKVNQVIADNTAVRTSYYKYNEVTDQELNKVFNSHSDKTAPTSL